MANYHGTRTVRTYVSDGRGPAKVETKTYNIGGPAGSSIGFAPSADFGNMSDFSNFGSNMGGQFKIDFGDHAGGKDVRFNVGGGGGGHNPPRQHNDGGGHRFMTGGGGGGGHSPAPAAPKPKVVGRPSRTVKKDPFSGVKSQKSNDIKSQCHSSGVLFEDPEFPCVDSNIFYSRPNSRRFEWKRPHVS